MHKRYLLPVVLTLAACSTPWDPIEPSIRADMNELSIRADMNDFTQHLFAVQSRGGGQTISKSVIQQLATDELRRPLSDAERADLGCLSDYLRPQFLCIFDHLLTRAQHAKDNGRVLHVMFYFNGGLNRQSDVLATAWDSYRHIEHEGLFPIFMIWPTGGLQSYGEDLIKIRSGRQTEWWEPGTFATIPLRPLLDFTRGLAATPQAWGTALTELDNTHFGWGSDSFMVKRDAVLFVTSTSMTDNPRYTVTPNNNLYYTENVDDVDRTGPPIARFATLAGSAALSPFRAISAPLIGPGEAAWRNMVRRTRTSIRAINEFPEEFDLAKAEYETLACNDFPETDGDDVEMTASKLQTCFPRGAGGFARFFQWLESCMMGVPITSNADVCPLDRKKMMDAKPLLANMRISMVGHSMGTIVINELIQLFPALPYKNLVYMAGAASVRDTARAVTPILRENGGCTHFYNLMLHPMNDSREPTGAGFLLSGSLLHYVDEFLEGPKTLPDRTIGQWRNIRMTRHLFPEEARKWMIHRVFDREAKRVGPGGRWLDRNPTEHGHFNDSDMPYWRRSFWKPANVHFPASDVNCDDLFSSRLEKMEKASAGS